ncbi:hypothetical protein [Methylobacterium sp. PvR107]|uniref:hypothetical protein n=1 Tax=Methylobacterium sp. PvR107 TaxID=2806597 RepID=UPI001AE23D4B|nr:hypothetical protein [Methylobacterium sp. PvR107]MBP1183032.1 hypothetical protein [Methylobacterium sp. PvR107]
MTAEAESDLQALAVMRAWHRWQIGQALSDIRTIQAHEQAITYLDLLIAPKKQHAAEDETKRRRADQGAEGAPLKRP